MVLLLDISLDDLDTLRRLRLKKVSIVISKAEVVPTENNVLVNTVTKSKEPKIRKRLIRQNKSNMVLAKVIADAVITAIPAVGSKAGASDS